MMKKVFLFLHKISYDLLIFLKFSFPLKQVHVPVATLIAIMIVTSLQSVSCSDTLRHANPEKAFDSKINHRIHSYYRRPISDTNYFTGGKGSQNIYSFYTDPSKVSHRILPPLLTSTFIEGADPLENYREQETQILSRQENGQGHHNEVSSMLTPPAEESQHSQTEHHESTQEQHSSSSGHEQSHQHHHEGHQNEDMSSEAIMPGSLEEALESLTTPGKLIPIINNLTLIALVILHLPALVPTVLIPLAFFCVGSLLIPIVRVNYFINHKDDGEDGRRRSLDFLSSFITNSINLI